jgi:hypothetical protein
MGSVALSVIGWAARLPDDGRGASRQAGGPRVLEPHFEASEQRKRRRSMIFRGKLPVGHVARCGTVRLLFGMRLMYHDRYVYDAGNDHDG